MIVLFIIFDDLFVLLKLISALITITLLFLKKIFFRNFLKKFCLKLLTLIETCTITSTVLYNAVVV